MSSLSWFIRFLPPIIFAILVFFWFGGALLPEKYTITRELRIDAPPGKVFTALEEAADWVPWYTGKNPNVRVEGQRIYLSQEDVVVVMEMVETSSPSLVRYRQFLQDAKDVEPVAGKVDLVPADGGTIVRMEETVPVDSGPARWMVYFSGDVLMGQVLARELHNLKSFVETGETHDSAPTR
ncbi:MAG: hypothetical protein HC923_00810 [Myxococcales bacterium]|nr:hypothetical protein [Myxococcales bacterium]